MYRIEIVDSQEFLINGWNFSDFNDLMIKYKKITHSLINRHILKGKTLQVFAGQDFENLHELEKYRLSF